MKITNWIFKKNRNIIKSNDNIVSGMDQPHSLRKALFLKVSAKDDISRKRALTLYRSISYNENDNMFDGKYKKDRMLYTMDEENR